MGVRVERKRLQAAVGRRFATPMARIVAMGVGFFLVVAAGSAAAAGWGVSEPTPVSAVVAAAAPSGPSSRVPAADVATAEGTSEPGNCTTLTEGNFGALTAEQQATGQLASNETACITITASAGPHWLRLNQLIASAYQWTLRNSGGEAVCVSTSNVVAACTIATSGTYTLSLTNKQPKTAWAYVAAFIGLSGTQGCAEPVGTAWTLPTISVTPTSTAQVFCQPFDARPGQTVAGLSNAPYRVLVDAAGTWQCQGVCVLPKVGGPFRLLALTRSTLVANRALTMEIRGISNPVGCPTITPAGYGAAPSDPENAIQCRTFSVAQAGSYLVRGANELYGNVVQYVYDPDGQQICDLYQFDPCVLPRAGTYTTFSLAGTTADTHPYFANVVPLNGPGCVPVSDRGAVGDVYRASIDTPTEIECLQLPTEAGAIVGFYDRRREQAPTKPEVAVEVNVYDADGREICWGQGTCKLSGPAPYRAVLQSDAGTGTYALAIQRLTGATGCPVLPRTGLGATVTVSADRHTRCLTFTAAHSGSQYLSWTNESGTAPAILRIYTPTGTELCYNGFLEPTFSCNLPQAGTYTVVLISDGEPATYRVWLGQNPIVCPTKAAAKGKLPAAGTGDEIPCVRPGKLR
jgi:hypothetical protein